MIAGYLRNRTRGMAIPTADKNRQEIGKIRLAPNAYAGLYSRVNQPMVKLIER
jgi:hypothetical protein